MYKTIAEKKVWMERGTTQVRINENELLSYTRILVYIHACLI